MKPEEDDCGPFRTTKVIDCVKKSLTDRYSPSQKKKKQKKTNKVTGDNNTIRNTKQLTNVE